MANILIKNILTTTSQQAIDIAMADDKIVSVGKVATDFRPDKTIDGNNKLAVAGFVNSHTHVAMTLFRSYADDIKLMDWLNNKILPAEDKLTNEDVYWGSMLGILEMIRSGTTCFADMYFFMDEVAKAVEETGIRACLSRGLAGVAPNSDKSLIEAVDFFKNWQNKADGRITTMLAPHAPYSSSPDYIKQIIAIAKDINANIHIHLSETAIEVANSVEKFGKTPIAHMDSIGLFDLGVLAAHCVHVTDAELDIIKAKNVRVAHNPQSNLKLASGIAPVYKMLEKGIIVGLGTDSAADNNNWDMLEEIRLAANLQKVKAKDPLVVPAPMALKMASEMGAKALGLDNVGILAEGYKADITIFDLHKPHLYPRHNVTSLIVNAANSADVDTVIIDGKIILDKGKFTSLDEEKIMAEVAKRGLELVK